MYPKKWEPRRVDIRSGWKNNPTILEEITTAINDEMYVEDESKMMEMMDVAFEWLKEKYDITEKSKSASLNKQGSDKDNIDKTL